MFAACHSIVAMLVLVGGRQAGVAENATVVALIKDTKALAALLNRLAEAEPVGIRTEAEPVGKPPARLKMLFAEPITGIQFEGIEPINDMVGLVQVDGTGQFLLVYHPAEPVGRPGPGFGEEVRIGSRVALDLSSGAGFARSLARPDSRYPLRVLGKPTSAGRGASGPWEVTQNAELRGINGRLITRFPERTSGTLRIIRVLSPGTETQVSRAVTGDDQLVPEGEYDVEVMKVRLAKVPIKKGYDTRIRIGAVTFAAGGNSRHSIFDAAGQKELFRMMGSEVMPLPEGKYSIKAGTRVIPFEIKDGQVTEL
jgi:hypothetical protein